MAAQGCSGLHKGVHGCTNKGKKSNEVRARNALIFSRNMSLKFYFPRGWCCAWCGYRCGAQALRSGSATPRCALDRAHQDASTDVLRVAVRGLCAEEGARASARASSSARRPPNLLQKQFGDVSRRCENGLIAICSRQRRAAREAALKCSRYRASDGVSRAPQRSREDIAAGRGRRPILGDRTDMVCCCINLKLIF